MKYNAVTVTQLNKYLKDRFDEDENLNAILVKGEISNFKNHYTGHLYFTLKDENSLIKCIMFKSYAEKLTFKPKDGMKVMVFGTVSVFERDGVYQIYAKSMMEDGIGDLHEQFEQLKAKLEKEGLFEQSHKKIIPLYPNVIGVLTSQTGAYFEQEIGINRIIGSIVLNLLCVIVFFSNIKGVLKASNLIVPFLIFFIFFIGIKNIVQIRTIDFYQMKNNWILSMIIYNSYNFILLMPVLISLKKQITKEKEYKESIYISNNYYINSINKYIFPIIKCKYKRN